MKISIALALVLFSIFLSGAQVSQQDDERFEPVSRLAGSCWEGAFPSGPRDFHCWEWALDGAFLRDRHEVRGAAEPYGGETFYGWDADAGVLRFWYFNSLGGRSEGSVEKLPGENRWLLVESYAGSTPMSPEESEIELRNFLTVGVDAYSVVTEQREGGSWKEIMSIRFERSSESR